MKSISETEHPIQQEESLEKPMKKFVIRETETVKTTIKSHNP
jgi:hypothetical protein